MSCVYVGLDLSLNGTGLVIINEEKKILVKELIRTNIKSILEDRFLSILYRLDDLIPYQNVEKLDMEGLSYGSPGNTMTDLAGLHHIVRLEFRRNFRDNYEKKVSVIPPSTLKKFITGKGNCKKNLMLLNVYKKFGESFDDDNLADAYSLARLALETKIKEDENGQSPQK